MAAMKGLCILGSTGSIGQSCLAVVRNLPERFEVIALSAGKNIALLADQIEEFGPRVAVLASPNLIDPLRDLLRPRKLKRAVRILAGTEGQTDAVMLPETSYVVAGAHGTTGLVATCAAAKAGKTVGLANKEVLVAAGEVFTQAAKESGAAVIPIDSEHCAIHQCLRSGEKREVARLILTASGGPFLKTPRRLLREVTPKMALNHPVWKMGGRITIDSSTLMNKGFEIIEARWLFGFPPDCIEVLIHPESLVHSMIKFRDGSLVAQLSIPDMRLPIQYALTYPERVPLGSEAVELDLTSHALHFRKPDTRRFPCLALARSALSRGGPGTCALNAADEVAVDAFVNEELRFTDIPRVIENVLERTTEGHLSTLADVLECDGESRRRAREAVGVVTRKAAAAPAGRMN
jgi:1-deoxy-D-xylulose-5-phosphate reductoisomerase